MKIQSLKVKQTVAGPDEGHDACCGGKAHDDVAESRAAQTRTDHVAGLDPGADDAVEHLTRAVDQHVGGIDRTREGLGDKSLIDHGGDAGREVLASQIATGVCQEAIQEQLGGAKPDAAGRPVCRRGGGGSGGVLFHIFSLIPLEIRSFRKLSTLYYGFVNISTLFQKNKSCKIAENPRDYLQK